jgi:NAD(P)-dependent dehydrogenase (short-subunit alcohol dehydrogenase family)
MTNPYSLRGKTILVTGASSGIGRAIAVESSKLGARLILVSRRRAELEKTLSLLVASDHHVVVADLDMGERLCGWMQDLAGRIGTIDGLVHSAGISKMLPLKATSQDEYRKLMAINLDASYWLIKAFRQRRVHATRGSIVLLGSVSGTTGSAGLTAYCASKGALIALAKAAALELVADNVRVNVISPAWVRTPMLDEAWSQLTPLSKQRIEAVHPMGLGQPEDVAYAAVYLLSDASRWVTGVNLPVDGGYTAA